MSAERPLRISARELISTRDCLRNETWAAAPKAKLSYMKQEEKALSFTAFVKDAVTAAGEIEKNIKELEGRTIHSESAEGLRCIA